MIDSANVQTTVTENEAEGQKPKKPKLTKAEKNTKKIEKKRLKAEKKIEKEKQLIRDHLNRELKYAKKNQETVTKDWFKFMNKLKSSQLKKNLEEIWAEFKYLTDRKDNYIQMMIDERVGFEEKFKWNEEKHLELVNYLKEISNLLANSLTSVFDTEVNNMLSEFQNEEYRKYVTEQRKIYLENIFNSSTTHAMNVMTASQNKFLQDAHELSISHIVQRDSLRDCVVKNMNKVYEQMRSLYDDVKSNTQTIDRVKVYQELMKNEQLHHEKVEIIQRKINMVEKEMAQLKEELHVFSSESAARLTKMKKEKELVKEEFQKCVAEFENNNRRDKETLKCLVVESEKTLTELKSVAKKGQNISDVTQLCKKYKTEKETIQPWDDRVCETNKLFKSSLNQHELKHLSKMDLFWYRTSQVKSTNKALVEEKLSLQKENENLQNLVRNYFHQQTYNADIASLKIGQSITIVTPTQEASEIFKQLKKV